MRRSGWSLYAFVFLTNHLHLVLKTPRPNLAKGMQLFLSSYANGWARPTAMAGASSRAATGPSWSRTRRSLGPDPLRPSQPRPGRPGRDAGGLDMVGCPGYFRRRDRLDWVAYDALLAAWAGGLDGPIRRHPTVASWRPV